MKKQDVIDYCITSPENINPAVLKSMLDGFEDGSDEGGDESE